ncbi:unnamed protein product [Medioppia subpectinata]|uniref:Eukaryotic translation initiation factor 3 subunit A n=1 Tax=Medioppia subpectinata TaxID=1979941 RepID=A0A7R9KS33_9ACAR|nr:unnamed protein product [Medioppia subpectinata]CAG2108335.1 unnamed protein product [Medioppia subpectinata]
MPIYFHRLENALKRAKEFIDVGKKPRALEILCDVLRSRKHRTWQKKHEDIMIKYLELCVELKKSYVAKEGIYQYKIICQQTYINSFEDVVRKYLEMAEEKATAAQKESKQSVLDVDDLDNAQTPEDILLSAVSNEDTQDRTDRVVLIPWVKFLWESYRQCLDLLKNNSRTERLYHDVAHQAFRFCINYNRKTEFRKLCDNLHTHLDILKKQQNNQQVGGHQQQNQINLNAPESQAMHLETRLVQLDCAIQMELWQEAYRATDDIKRFGLMNLTKKPPKPQLMANYYQKLALVFWKANCPLFHSAALFRLFHLSKELRKNITQEDIQKMATKVVTATLAIPIPPNRAEIDKLVDTEENVIEGHQRNLASLLGLTTSVPTRGSLIKDLKRMGVLQYAAPKLQELYRCLEIDFHPLVLCNRVLHVIDYINESTEYPELKQYTNALKDVTAMRLLKEVSQVYQTIEFKRLLELCPFANFTYLEKVVVEAARRNDLQVRIDHKRGCLIFGAELRVSTGEEVIEGPHLQSMPSEQIRKQLVSMYSTLQKARNLIEPDRLKNQREEMKRKIMKAYRMNWADEHKQVLSRQSIIEQRKEDLERISIAREEQERRKVEEQQRRIRDEEEAKMALEIKEREQQMKAKQDLEIKKQMAKDQISMMKGALTGNLLDMDDEELAKLRPEDIHSRRIEQLEKERRDQLVKQRKLERKVDHLERAKRLEEIPLLEKSLVEWKEKDSELWEQMEDERIKDIKEERRLALEIKSRFLRVMDDKEIFSKKIVTERHSVFVEKLAKFEDVLAIERKRRLADRKVKRKQERKEKYIAAKEAEEKRIRDEEQRKIEEEKAAKYKEQQEKQRLRELEIEEKMKQMERDSDDRQKRQRDVDPEERQPREEREREREPDRETNWRRPNPNRPPIPADGPTRGPADDEDFQNKGDRNQERRPPPPSRADVENDWRRGERAPEPNADKNDRNRESDRKPQLRADGEEEWHEVKSDKRTNRNTRPEEEKDWRGGRGGERRDGERRVDDRRDGERRVDDRRDGERRVGDRRDDDRRDGDRRGDRSFPDRNRNDRPFDRNERRFDERRDPDRRGPPMPPRGDRDGNDDWRRDRPQGRPPFSQNRGGERSDRGDRGPPRDGDNWRDNKGGSAPSNADSRGNKDSWRRPDDRKPAANPSRGPERESDNWRN